MKPAESTLTPCPTLPTSTTQTTQLQLTITRQPTNATSIEGFIMEVTRNYSDEIKYDGANGSFDLKLIIFRSICGRVELPEQALAKEFPIMLEGLALS